MDKLKLLYQSYLDKGLISEKTSFDQFSSASPKQLMSLYSLGIENNLISQKTELDTFSSAWYPEKKKIFPRYQLYNLWKDLLHRIHLLA